MSFDPITEAFAVYVMNAFGHYNASANAAIWERKNRDLDLVLGAGFDGDFDVRPTLVTHSDHHVSYYSFDGVNDYISGWPEMPAEYTVVALTSSDYPDGFPGIVSYNDDTLQTALTTMGGFTGNLHSLMLFNRVLDADELLECDRVMAKRLWRDRYIDPWTALQVRNESCVLCLYCEEQSIYHPFYYDYALGLLFNYSFSISWDNGVSFPAADSALMAAPESALNIDGAISIFIEAENWDVAPAGLKYILQNGTSYSVIIRGGDPFAVYFNGTFLEHAVSGFRTLAITCVDGEKPKFYANGSYIGEGESTRTVSSVGADYLVVGNGVARDKPFGSTLKKLSMYNRALSAVEIRATHFGAMATRTFNT